MKKKKKKTKENLGPKMFYVGLWDGMLKNYCHICNQRLPICLIVKFCEKIKILKLGIKTALFGCSGQ